ncbi:MAG: DUF305 domain-containing protein [Methylotenera sp.]|jgi:uncharacterized protein (DUF305 family)|nr:DUF305 domain-containing protein [Methylococcales bacterium]PPC93285.1 MAG: DUF305 domain-containing protein [Methylotenera sp.]
MKEMMHKQAYLKLLYMVLLSFASMYILMYAMVNQLNNVIPNINQFYMAGLMTMPMVLIEMIVMSAMYMDKNRNKLIIILSFVGLVGFFLLIRFQGAVSEKQFLKSMIPHHASAILMCKETKISDPEIQVLCSNIVSGQQQEIAQMKTLLDKQ